MASRDRMGEFRTAFGGNNAQDATGSGHRDTYSMMSTQSSGTTQYHFNDPRYKASGNESGSGVSGIDNPLARDTNYDDYDNDANFHSELNSIDNPEAYVHNRTWSAQELQDRWQQGGGIDTGGKGKTGAMSGKSRDEDGTIDRVRDPPKELLPLLYAMRMSCEAYHIGSLEDAMLAAGGTHYGVIPTTKFGSCIATLFPRLGLTEENLLALVTAYGCGDKVPERSHRAKLQPFDMCAWADFAEDVQKAVDPYAGSADLPGRAADIYPRGIRY